jgi:hypothetical protein
MENKRILISENKEVINKIDQVYANEKRILLDRANSAMFKFAEFDETFNETGSTTTKYNELLATGAQPFITAAINKIKEQFLAVNITSSAVMSVATERTEQAGNDFLKAYNDLLRYLEVPSWYPELKFDLSDVKFENGLAAIKAEKDLEALKDQHARTFIDTQVGYDLIDKAGTLALAINSLNDYLGSKGIAEVTTLEDLRNYVDYAWTPDQSLVHLDVNKEEIYYISKEIDEKQRA